MDRLSLPVAMAAFSAFVAAATYGVLALLGLHLSWAYGALIALLGLATWLLHAWQEGQLLTDPKGFVRRFMLGLVLKMMMALLLIVLILVAFPRTFALPLALAFAFQYLAFLVFSAVRLMGRSRT